MFILKKFTFKTHESHKGVLGISLSWKPCLVNFKITVGHPTSILKEYRKTPKKI